MLYYKIVFGVCLLLLFVVHTCLMAAKRRGDQGQARVLHFFRLGLSLSAISYVLRITDISHAGHSSIPVFMTCFLGTIFLWLGWREHWHLRAGRRSTPPRREEDEPRAEAPLTLSSASDNSRLTARARQAVLQAQYEAYRRQECCVDTNHLLLGLLHDSRSAGAHVLYRLGAGPEKVHLGLLREMASLREFTKPPRHWTAGPLQTEAEPLALTERADQVLALAAQEAYRFDSALVGTEHLLLGLVLVGKGKAATVLFREGVTVDGIRSEIIKARKDG